MVDHEPAVERQLPDQAGPGRAMDLLDPARIGGAMGVGVSIRRAWPAAGGSLTFEARETATGRIRAGAITAEGGIRGTAFGADPALTGLTSAVGTGELLVHRFGKRAVLKQPGAGTNPVFVKILRAGKVGRVAHAHQYAQTLASGCSLGVPRVLAEDRTSLTLSAVPGTSLFSLGSGVLRSANVVDGAIPEADPSWTDAWIRFTELWPRFARSASDSLPLHTALDEYRTVHQWVAHAQTHGTLDVDPLLIKDSLEQLRLKLCAVPAQDPVLAHRDLHDKQVFFDAERNTMGLIDCDTLALAEPALDLANLLVHLDLRQAQGLLGAATAATAAAQLRETASLLGVSTQRLDAYAAATRLRLACVYSFRPSYRALARRWALQAD